MGFDAIVIGSSAGGLNALKTIITGLPHNFSTPIILTQHLSPHSDSYIAEFLNQLSHLTIKEADGGEKIMPSHVYIAPPNFHLLVEEDFTLNLTVDEKINYSRPSIDILFETAAIAYKNKLIGIILTGANNDGSNGIIQIKTFDGFTIAQSPESAEVAVMPRSAIETGHIDKILPLQEIAAFLVSLCC
ncbi:MAG: chemotaxis protein CheB [Bacteroidales bacterium]|nr:chemotaxis protein CheB [Bacteroidales bacterium]